jgi:transcriptional regulator with XRE-family HTH domain
LNKELMQWIPAKLRAIRQQLGLTQAKAAEASGLSQRDVSQLENGRKEGIPKEYMHFLHTRGIDLNWLFSPPEPGVEPVPEKNYAALPTDSPALVQEDWPVGYGPPKQVGASAGAVATAIRMVDVAVGRQYPQHFASDAFVQMLPVLSLPLPQGVQGQFRCFQVADEQALPPLRAQDWVVGQLTELTTSLVAEAGYVVVTPGGLSIHRPGSPPTAPDLRDVKELWRVIAHLSFQLGAAPVSTLEASYQDLLARVQRLEQGR